MAKVGFVSLGCAKNLVDTEIMLGMISQGGYEITACEADAEIIVVNTCGFIESAKEESIETILEMARQKTTGCCRRLIVAGCLVERYRSEIMDQIPEVDAVIGTGEIPRILEACCSAQLDPPRYENREAYLYSETDPRILTTPRYSTYIKISEGCNHPCTFCVIPRMRGRFQSRPLESILAEARNLARLGVREFNLVAQDSTMYGRDRGKRNGLVELLRGLSRIQGLTWIRILYAYPNTITDELLEAMAEIPRVCNYVDVPLQHASGRMLKRMKRGGDRQSLTRLLERIRGHIPDVAVRTTMIVGFPGEREEDFRELEEFVEEARFDRLGVFTYSDEREAVSHSLDGKVAEEIKRERRRRLMVTQEGISREKNRALVGTVQPVMVHGPSPESELLWEGRMSSQAPEIDGVVYLNDGVDSEVMPGDILPVLIKEAHSYDLVGEVFR